MKIVVIILGCLLFTHIAFSQEKTDSLIINSLHFLDKKFHLNFEKAGEYILVLYNGDYYIVDKYSKAEGTIIRAMIIYELQKKENEKYSFSLKWAGEIKGSFELVIKNVKYRFKNLRYVDISH